MRARTVLPRAHFRTAIRAASRVGLVALLLASTASTASAHPGITGYSGKPYNGVSETCTTNCHAKGANPPVLAITVPATVEAGSTTQVTIAVTGNRVRTSMNAAFTDGVQTIKGTNTDTPLAAQEPTEIAAVVPPPGGAAATYKFSFVAPKVAGSITMYVAGMAASGSGTGGDAVSTTTRMIMVTALDAGTTSDAGSSGDASASGGPSGTSGTSGMADGGSSSGSSGGAGSSSGHASPSSDENGDSGGCALGGRVKAPAGAHGASLVGLSLMMGLAIIARRRIARRRRDP